MIAKRHIVIMLLCILSLSIIFGGCSEKQTTDPAQTSYPTFDETYRDLSFGPTNGTNFCAKFSGDGTFTAVCYNGQDIYNGTYTYADGKLSVSLRDYENIEFAENGEGFTSVEEYVAQAQYRCHFTINKSTEASFLELYDNAG